MKRIITILLLIICFGSVSNVRASAVPDNINKIDTLLYLKGIVGNKANYIGKPFSVLLNDLQIQIKRFSPISGLSRDISKETETLFSFYFPQSIDEFHLTRPCLRVSWQPYLNATTSTNLFVKHNGGGWVQEVIDFYANAIIEDIDILN